MEQAKIKLYLIAEDQKLINAALPLLEQNGYEVILYGLPGDAFAAIEKNTPSVILSEYDSPNINGMDLCKDIRKNFLLRYVPVILLLNDEETGDREKLIYSGADDYIRCSFIGRELPIKIKLNLYRIARHQDINPLTGLPGQSSLLLELQKRIGGKNLFALQYADIYRIREYNQRYGFKKGDELIKYTADLILKTLKRFGSPSDFLAHTRDDDFIFLTLPDSVDKIADQIAMDFDKDVAAFYDADDSRRGYIMLKSRKGEIQKTPFLRICIGVVTNEFYQFTNPGQMIQVALELREFANKSFQKSFYVKDRRKSYTFH
jgi:CheY-like chemotaxis protein